MARTNVPRSILRTHGGGKASFLSHKEQLERSVMAHLLWEDEFYEDGATITARIKNLIPLVDPKDVAQIAIRARNGMKLRHVPLLIAREMARSLTHKGHVRNVLNNVIQRADELAEFLAIYWKDGKVPLAAQVKKGLADAFTHFNEYELAKYNRDNDIKLRDVLFLVHAKPVNSEQAAVFRRLAEGNIITPDTWEVSLSKGKDKKATWERLIREHKLGALALIRNLRNMTNAKVNKQLIAQALATVNVSRVLPFRFITAEKYAPDFSAELEDCLFRCFDGVERLPGVTVLVVDVSGSMYGSLLSGKGESNRSQVASALAILAREMCEYSAIYATAGSDALRRHATEKMPNRRGFSLGEYVDQQCRELGGGGIFLKQVMDYIARDMKGTPVDRVIVITDEQDCDTIANSPDKALLLGRNNYIINVGSSERGIAYSNWTHISGWSEAVLNYIAAFESYQAN